MPVMRSGGSGFVNCSRGSVLEELVEFVLDLAFLDMASRFLLGEDAKIVEIDLEAALLARDDVDTSR
jgi:hypothetical protein